MPSLAAHLSWQSGNAVTLSHDIVFEASRCVLLEMKLLHLGFVIYASQGVMAKMFLFVGIFSPIP